MTQACAEPDCDRTSMALGLCRKHYDQGRRRRGARTPAEPRTHARGDDVFMACPKDALGLAGAIAEIDSRRVFWRLWILLGQGVLGVAERPAGTPE